MYPAGAAQNIAGGPYVACFSGATPFVVADNFAVAVANDYGGLLTTAAWKFLNTPALGVRFPVSTSAWTIAESLASLPTAMTTYISVPEYNIPPASYSAASYSTTPVDLRLHPTVMFVVMGGTLSGGATIDAKVQYSSTSGGSYSDLSGGAITQITTNSKIATVEVDLAKLPAGNFWVKLTVTVGSASAPVAVLTEVADGTASVGFVTQRLNLVV
jgi:hypothetical protein